jgi:hypothetical protein
MVDGGEQDIGDVSSATWRRAALGALIIVEFHQFVKI